ncbi:MAG: type II toxin-antitoxin system Phd/YefM family antitoxin [Micrococcales bacterium]|nr:type II toxin-antitoxin system Phd/YefM family antitoxin [Micrococcales bacterium]
MTTVPLATVKARLSSYVDEVVKTHERITITRNAVPTTVLVSVDDLESLEETLAILSDSAAMAQISQATQEVD